MKDDHKDTEETCEWEEDLLSYTGEAYLCLGGLVAVQVPSEVAVQVQEAGTQYGHPNVDSDGDDNGCKKC